MLLVLPIITYAAPILCNCNHTVMETLRCLERKSLRACLSLYRSQCSNWQHYVKNLTFYDKAEIPRIDSVIIKISRDYFSKLQDIDNAVIQSLAKQSDALSNRQLATGYVTPQTFFYCDQRGLVQNEFNIPVLYHWQRNKANKKVAFVSVDIYANSDNFKFSLA